MNESETIQGAILALERQRVSLGDAATDAAILALREKASRLRQARHPAEKRKQITVLFADITDFTKLLESLDPEKVTELLDLLWRRIDRVILERGGRIDKHMGDAVMAFWGTERSREDDPEQAVRAAMDIKTVIQELRAEVTLPIPLSFCTGISTGPVVLGTLSTTGEYTAIGPTVNLAYRLEGIAPADSILISETTHRHVRTMFRSYALPPLALRGFGEPVQAYQIIDSEPQARQQEARGIAGVTPAMVGRQNELEQVQTLYHSTLTEQRATIIAITGEAGIGKSRLVQEFVDWTAQQTSEIPRLEGRSRQGMHTVPFALLRDMLSRKFGIYENDRPTTISTKLEQGFRECLAIPERIMSQAAMIGTLLGFNIGDSPFLDALKDDPEQLHYRATQALLDCFRVLCSRKGLLIVLEDLQWADSSSRELLLSLVTALEGMPLLVVASTRTDSEQGALLPTLNAFPVHAIPLKALNAEESRQLIAAILHALGVVSPALEEVIIERAGGNPFYVEELIQSLIDARILSRTGAEWRVDAVRLNALQVPQTLTALLQARFDALPPTLQETLQRAAIIGPVFWTAAVAALEADATGEPSSGKWDLETGGGIDDCQGQLEMLVQRGMLVRHPSSAFVGTQEYSFRHVLMHEVVYGTTLLRQQRIYHARAAHWLKAHSQEHAGDLWGWIAEHSLRAEATGEAIVALQKAGQRAAARFANGQALGYFTRALALTQETDVARRFTLYLALEAVYDVTSERGSQHRALVALEHLGEALGDDRCRLEVALRRAPFAEATGDYPAAISAAQQAITLAQRCDIPCREAEGLLLWARALTRQGNYPQAQEHLERARAILEKLSEDTSRNRHGAAYRHRILADVLRALGVTHWYQGQRTLARESYESALQRYEALGHSRGEAHCLNNLGALLADSQPEEALAFHRQALNKYREIGNRAGEGIALSNIAGLFVTRGKLDTARTAYLETLELRRTTGDLCGQTVALSNLGEIALQQGHYKEAQTCFENSLKLNREIGNRQGEGGNLGNLGMTALQLGDYETASGLLEQALETARGLGLRRAECDILLAMCQLHFEINEPEVALRVCEQALALAQELQLRITEAEVLLLLGYIHEQMGERAAARDAFERALDVQRNLGQYHLTLESRAVSARLALEESQTSEALTAARREARSIIHTLHTQSLGNAAGAVRITLACYHLLAALGDERAVPVLEQAYRLLEDRASRLPDDAARQRYLEAAPTNREIVRAWREHSVQMRTAATGIAAEPCS